MIGFVVFSAPTARDTRVRNRFGETVEKSAFGRKKDQYTHTYLPPSQISLLMTKRAKQTRRRFALAFRASLRGGGPNQRTKLAKNLPVPFRPLSLSLPLKWRTDSSDDDDDDIGGIADIAASERQRKREEPLHITSDLAAEE